MSITQITEREMALQKEVERLKLELAAAKAEIAALESENERRIVKINQGQECVSQWIAEHSKLNRETAIEIACLRTELAAAQAVLKQALNVLSEFQCSIDLYNKNGPDWTHKDGTEVFEVSVLTDRAEMLESAITAIEGLIK